MLALGWHPSQIADLIHSRFREDHHWNDIFSGYDPRFRADFYTGYLQDLYGSNSTARSISAVGLPRNKDGVSTRLATIFWNIINNP